MSFSLYSSRIKELPSLKIAHTESHIHAAVTNRIVDFLTPIPAESTITVVCVGTDRSTGDCLGPLVGTALSKFNSPLFEIYGTLDHPVHAVNLSDTLQYIESSVKNPFIIGIDACLGQTTSVGNIQVASGPVRPGAGVHKQLPPVGDMHITGIVNVGGFMEYFVLQNTRLSLVMKLSDIIANSLYMAIKQWHHRLNSYAGRD
ncbi:spore protease YyaC [Paenibacillus guangzhouensis]|uniref:spore protease YyaC n=1 Tax=Paenibacillus guangzhouensis TaxID=1473112 RepID=UPI001266F0E1|nr:spore protease YyaC [Paenibacillus guangzhouensis]